MQFISYCALLVLLMLTALVVAADNLPDPVTNAPISCAGKERCQVARFQVSEGRYAECEMRYNEKGKRIAGRCRIDPPRESDAG